MDTQVICKENDKKKLLLLARDINVAHYRFCQEVATMTNAQRLTHQEVADLFDTNRVTVNHWIKLGKDPRIVNNIYITKLPKSTQNLIPQLNDENIKLITADTKQKDVVAMIKQQRTSSEIAARVAHLYKAAEEAQQKLNPTLPTSDVVFGIDDALEIFGLYRSGWPINSESLSILYKGLAFKRHPDKGGSNDSMLKLNAAHQMLKRRTEDER